MCFVEAEEPAITTVVNMFTGPVLSLTRVKKEVLQATKSKKCVQIPDLEKNTFFPKIFKATHANLLKLLIKTK